MKKSDLPYPDMLKGWDHHHCWWCRGGDMIIECSTTVGTWLNLDRSWLRVIRIERVLHVLHLTPVIIAAHAKRCYSRFDWECRKYAAWRQWFCFLSLYDKRFPSFPFQRFVDKIEGNLVISFRAIIRYEPISTLFLWGMWLVLVTQQYIYIYMKKCYLFFLVFF